MESSTIALPRKRTKSSWIVYCHDGPVIRAASSDNIEDLTALFQTSQQLSDADKRLLLTEYVHVEYLDNQWDTPLLRATACGRTQNVQLLLENGFNPNGIDLEWQELYSLRFRRFPPEDPRAHDPFVAVTKEDVKGLPHVLAPLGEDEITSRHRMFCHFWAPPNLLPTNFSKNGDCLHSLVVAAGTKDTNLFSMLHNAGADATFWLQQDAHQEIPELLTPSAACLSTPLHKAVDADDAPMLAHLMAAGFNSNARALLAGPQAFTPLQFAVIKKRMRAYRWLSTNTDVDSRLVTPVFKVHLLHFAVAHLDLALLDAISIPLSDASPTALGHTLFHVACMPENEQDIRILAPKIFQSIHEARTLNSHWLPAISTYYEPSHPPEDQLFVTTSWSFDARRSIVSPRRTTFGEIHVQQTAIVKRLSLILGTSEFDKADIHGNTALHYLASFAHPNDELIGWLQAHRDVEKIWNEAVNIWGHTPHDLYNDQEKAITEAEHLWPNKNPPRFFPP